MNSQNVIMVIVGEFLFAFRSFNDWVNNAQSRFACYSATARNTICVDAKGRVCLSGKEFMRAHDEDAFPITVYWALCDHVEPRLAEREAEETK